LELFSLLASGIMRPTLAQVCTLNSGFADDIQEFAAGKCSSIELWFTKLENYLLGKTIADVRQLFADHEVTAPVASYQGGLLASQGDARREAWGLFEKRLEICRQLGVETLIVACDIPPPLHQTDLDRVQASLVQLAQMVGKCGLRAALEFQAQSAFGNNLQTVAALVGEVSSPHLGICLDAFHYYIGPSKPDDLGYLTVQNLFHVQLCDLADVPREVARDSQRILPGEGDIALTPILDRLRDIQYEGCVSIELMNPHIWQVGPRQFGEVGMTALRKVLGMSSMK
jgi:2-keto-myo-inositol isomerase